MSPRRSTGLVCALFTLWVFGSACAAGGSPVFRFAILSDRTGGHVHGVYPRVIEEINLLNPDIVVTVGDHIEGYTDDVARVHAEWDSLFAIIGRLEAPVYMLPGNHDIWSDESEAVFIERVGRNPYYSFDYENTHFIILDTSRIDSSEELPEEQRAWLVKDLKASRDKENTFVFCHKPFWASTLERGMEDPLHEIFLKHGVDAVFTGHFHHYFSADYDGIDYTVIGSSGGAIWRMDEPVVRGEFFQFGWVTVMSPGYELAVVHLGELYPRDVVTVEGLDLIDRIENELIQVSEVRVAEETSVWADITVAVENVTEEDIDDMLKWDTVGDWQTSPSEAHLAVEPGAIREVGFLVTNRGTLFPAPSLTFGYPLGAGKVLDVDVPLRIRRTRTAGRFEAAPVIDGKITESCWSRCRATTELYSSYEGSFVEGETRFLFGYDDDNLYLAAICYDQSMDEIVTNATERDGSVWMDDCVGYFFQPNTKEMVIYQIYMSPLGTVFDRKITFDERMNYDADSSWNGDYDVAAHRAHDRWCVEARIPLDEIGADIGSKTTWRTNFRRKQQRTGSAMEWQTPLDYDPSTFGEVAFE